MESNQPIDELQRNFREIKRQNRLKRLRFYLKFLLFGFLIGRDSEKIINELVARNKELIDKLFTLFAAKTTNLESQIRNFSDAFTKLAEVQEEVNIFEREVGDAKNYLSSFEQSLNKYHEMLIFYAKNAIEKKEKVIYEHVEKILNSGTYLIHSEKQYCLNKLENFREDLNHCNKSQIFEEEYINEKKKITEKYKQEIADYNKNFVTERKREYAYLWQKGLLSLDHEQQLAIVTDDKHNLVVAAAGSGKTETLITRIAYLIKRKPDSVEPSRILAIAYQNKDVNQIRKRLERQYDITGVNVKTFHTLGIDVLERANKMKKILGKNDRPLIVKKIYREMLKSDPDFYKAFLNYVKSLHETEKDETDITDTFKMRRTSSHTSIDGTCLKSKAEKVIMDFLLTSKINQIPIKVKYEFEIEELGKPDFYLPEYDLFIEHWGLNKNGEVPEWFDQTTAEYKENIERKKLWFAKNNKLIVETFSYEYNEEQEEAFLQLLKDRILKKLEEKYDQVFHLSQMNYEELIEVVLESDRDWISEERMVTDLLNFIKNAKTYDLKPERIIAKLEKGNWSLKQQTFGKLAVQVYLEYQKSLLKQHQVDFEDMINNAINELKNDYNLCNNIYDHILVDEYQDITQQTHSLVEHILSHNPNCKLFCVGDDWQSIMGFAGSNLDFFVNFNRDFDNPEITNICTNYRSTGTIVNAGACLIKNNKCCHIPKRTVSHKEIGSSIEVLKLLHKPSHRKNYYLQIAQDCLCHISDYLKKGYREKDILVLSRFIRIHRGQYFQYHPIIENFFDEAKLRGIKLSDDPRTSQRIRLLSVHRAKGLEAKVVFLLNAIKDTYGFPCEIEDSSILEPARENYPRQDQKEEERRLFYVAMTRAMEKLHIYTWDSAMSEFLEEIRNYTVEERINY